MVEIDLYLLVILINNIAITLKLCYYLFIKYEGGPIMKSKIIHNYKVLNNSQIVGKSNNYFLISMSQTEICPRGGGFLNLVSKRLIRLN